MVVRTHRSFFLQETRKVRSSFDHGSSLLKGCPLRRTGVGVSTAYSTSPPLKMSFRVIPSFFSRSLGASFWDAIVENLEEVKDRLLALPPSLGQTLSNQELFNTVLEDVRRAMALDPSTSFTESDDDQCSLFSSASDPLRYTQ